MMRKLIAGATWLVAERLLGGVVGLLVLAVAGRALGPEQYGSFAYVVALAALFSTLGHMGLDGLLVRELVSTPAAEREILGTVFVLRLIGYLVGAGSLVAFGLLSQSHTDLERALFALLALSVLFSPFSAVVTSWLRSRSLVEIGAWLGLASATTGGAAKIALVFAGLGAIGMGIGQVAAGLVAMVAGVALLHHLRGPTPMQWRVSWQRARSLIGEASLIFLGSLFAVIYLRIDHVMLRLLKTPEAVGAYAVATHLFEAVHIVPIAAVTAAFPVLIALRRDAPAVYRDRLQGLFDVLSGMGVLTMMGIALVAPMVVRGLVGPAFAEASLPLVALAIALPFVFIRFALSRWILIEGLAGVSAITQAAGAGLNVVLNLLLIPQYGAVGAAAATVAAYVAATYGALALHERTKPVFGMMTLSLFRPWRGLLHLAALRRALWDAR